MTRAIALGALVNKVTGARPVGYASPFQVIGHTLFLFMWRPFSFSDFIQSSSVNGASVVFANAAVFWSGGVWTLVMERGVVGLGIDAVCKATC